MADHGSEITPSNILVSGLGGDFDYGEIIVPRNDDGFTEYDISSVFEDGLNFFGNSYANLFVNTNGNVTFGDGLDVFTPTVISGNPDSPIIAPFWADVDTRDGGSIPSAPISLDLDTVGDVVTVTWPGVNYFSQQGDLQNYFQLQLFDRGDGDADIVFRYQDIQWTSGEASSGVVARAGYNANNGVDTFELPQSGNLEQMLDLENIRGNTGVNGLWTFQVRNGDVVPNHAPSAANDLYTQPSGQSLVVDATHGVLNNDTDLDGDPLSATLVRAPSWGTLDFNADGSFRYTPIPGYRGPDSFDYRASDGLAFDTARANINVEGGFVRAITSGDPHLTTFDNVPYDFQAVGEFVLARGNDVEVQVRQVAAGPSVTVNTAVAIRVGSNVISLYAGEPNPFLVNGVTTNLEDGGIFAIGDFSVHRSGSVYQVFDGLGDSAWINVHSSFLDIALYVDDSNAGDVEGLLGNADGNPGNDFALEDGTILSQPLSPEEIYGAFADAWRVTPETSLFIYGPGESTETFTDRSFPLEIVTIDDLDPEVRAAAEAIVRDAGVPEGTLVFNNAVLDVALTGNPEFADAAAENPASGDEPGPIPPVNEAPVAVADNASTVENTAVIIDVLANDSDPEGDALTLLSGADPAGGTVAVENGMLVYTPPADFHGVTTLTYIVGDSAGNESSSSAEVTVEQVGESGGPDDDVFLGEIGDDTYHGGAGSDQVAGGNGRDTLYGDDGNDRLGGGNGDDGLYGGADDDSLRGGNGQDLLDGGSGNDTLDGGNDDDHLDGGNGADTLNGGNGADTLLGGNGDDTLAGGNRADTLEGGAGTDDLTGGTATDTFVFRDGFGNDTINDFHVLGAQHDILQFDTSLFADAADLFAHSADTAEGIVFTSDLGDTLLVKNATVAQLQLHPEDLHFV